MSAAPRPHTWIRWAASRLPWDAPRFAALWMLLAGLTPSAVDEVGRQVARMQVPVPGTNPGTIPYLLRRFGLPAYVAEQPYTASAGYLAVLARLRDAWATHARAGATAMLDAELARAGLAGATIVNLSGTDVGARFAVAVPTSGPAIEWDDASVFDDGHTFDRELTSTESQGLAAVIAYFKPARSQLATLLAEAPTYWVLGVSYLPAILGEEP